MVGFFNPATCNQSYNLQYLKTKKTGGLFPPYKWSYNLPY